MNILFISLLSIYYFMLILVPYSVDPDQLASQKLADLDLHSEGIVIIRQYPKFLLMCFTKNMTCK